MKLKDILNEGAIKYNPKEISIEFEKRAKEWKKFIDNKFVGKTISTKANKGEDRGNWKDYTIKNIKQTQIGSYFGTEINVQDENGDWYTLLRK